MILSFPTLSSAESSLYRSEGWREGKRNRVGDDGKGRDKKLTPFRSSHRPSRAFYFSITAIFIGMPSESLSGGESQWRREPLQVFFSVTLSSKALKEAA